MSDAPPELVRLQRWMQAAITGARDPEAAAAPDGTPLGIDDVITASGSQTAGERLEVYRHAYGARLLECFRSEYPVLRHALGDELFEHFARDYLARHPPAGYTLFRLGERFPGHLAATRPDREAPAAEREAWIDFIVELATLERSFLEIYDGPGLEDEPPGDPASLPPPKDWARTRLVPSPSLRLARFRFPVDRYFQAVRAGEDPPLPAPRATLLALLRRDYVVRFVPLEPAEHAALERLHRGEDLAAASSAAGELAEKEVARRCRGWLERGFFRAVEVDPTTTR